MIKILVLIIISVTLTFAQETDNSLVIPKDTSYTLYSAAKKMYKKFPAAKLVIRKDISNVREISNLVYAEIGNRKLHIDIFYPTNFKVKKFPGVLMIHGGGWASGDTSLVIPMAQRIASKGYVTVAVEYRLSPEALYPAAVYDLKAAIRWMRANSDKYHIDSTKIAAYGCSAGGHLSALVGTTNFDKKLEGKEGNNKYSSSVQAVIDVDGVVDYFGKGSKEVLRKHGKAGAAERWFGVSAKKNPEVWKEAGPINHLDKNDPPILFINSGVPRFHAGQQAMIKMMKSFNIYYEVHTFKGTIHTFWLFKPWFNKTFNYAVDFLNRVFKSN